MNYFESLLNKHLEGRPPKYLWELKVSDDEYAELKRIITDKARLLSRNCNRFMSICKECTLFVAEYWRREYNEGAHSKEMIFNAIGTGIKDIDIKKDFFDAARRGAEALKIEIFKGGKTEYLDSMLYQGGLPMKLVTGSNTGVWDRFTRGLVNRKINFEELNLGVVASNSNCLKEYCNRLILGIESEQYMLMPFYCENENDPWFVYLKELAKEEISRSRQTHPFSLAWEFRIDTIEHQIYTKYELKGLQRLPESFVSEQNLQDTNFFTVQVRKNGQAVDTFDYVNNFCRYRVISKHPYKEGDYISLYIHHNDEPYIAEELDMRVPHLLYQNKDGMYEIGNCLGSMQSFLLIPEGWEVGNASIYDINEYLWSGITIKGIKIPADHTDDIIIKGEDGNITFGINSPLYWTELLSYPKYNPNIIEPLYDAQRSTYALCSDFGNGTKAKSYAIKYRNKWQDSWTDTPSYGEIFARATDPNGNFVAPMRFINIGDGLKIDLCSADKDSCQIKVVWPHGHVSTTEGERKANDVWEIKKANCKDPRIIRFLFTPQTNSKNQFHLSVKAPFKAFSIINIYGDNITDNSVVPYSDIDKYQYHLVGQDIKEYVYGDQKRELRWKNDNLYIVENGSYKKTIPYEGSLLTLFDSHEMLRSLLDRTSKNIIDAKIDVRFVLSNGKTLNFEIKESPYRPNQTKDGRIEITDSNKNLVKFKGVLKFLKLDEPEIEPKEVSINQETGSYILPDDITHWGKAILIGRTRGRIRPALIDFTRDLNGDSRKASRDAAISDINKNLELSSWDDPLWQRIIGWYNRSQKEDIPASSILELHCVAQNPQALIYLTFQLYVNCANDIERDILKEKLKSFSSDLAFQWYWLKPYLQNGIFNQIQAFIANPEKTSIKNVYIKWAMNHDGAEVMTYLNALNDTESFFNNIIKCLKEETSSYEKWMDELCVSSLLENYNMSCDDITKSLAETIVIKRDKIVRVELKNAVYVDSNQDYLGDETGKFFNKYSQNGKYGNELWLYKRVNAVAAHLNKQIDLFGQIDEIRRSIIFCSKSSNEQFIITLNNQLVR